MADIFHYRDYTASQEVTALYKKEMELVEPAYVDTSKLRGGLLSDCNLRYLILSDKSLDLGLMNTNAKRFGLVVFPRGLRWRVLDKHTLGEVTQILITPHSVGVGALEQAIELARSDFNELRYMQPVPILDTNEWKDRLFFPVGIKENGAPYPTGLTTETSL